MTNSVPQHRTWLAWLTFLTALPALPASRLGFEVHGQELRGSMRRVDTTPLRQVEERTLPPCIVPGPWAHEDLTSYYWAANSQLATRFNHAREAYENSSHRGPYRALTLVAGAAGVGKSFITHDVFDKCHRSGSTCRLDLKQLYQQWHEQGQVRAKPDLGADSLVLSSLLSRDQPDDGLLLKYLVQQDARFYVIDSLDEVHPDDHVRLLKQIEQFVFRSQRKFVHVVVFGRHVAFRDYWQERARDEEMDAQLHLLDSPGFRTTGDLQVSSWNHHSWRYKLGWTPNGGAAASPVPLQAYEEWTRLNFDRAGDFQSVSYTSNVEMTPDVHTTLTHWARMQPIVAGILQNLAGNSIIREVAADFVNRGRPYDERDVMEAYFHAWLQRGTLSHDRPSSTNPEHLDLYLRLLEAVAVKYLVAGRVGEQGYFEVADDDVVEIYHDESLKAFPAKKILNGSGLVHLDPRETGPARYRFEPVWMHRLLVEKHNQRSALNEM